MSDPLSSLPTPDFQALFESAPASYLVLTPDFTIVAVTDAYLQATMTKREEILGHKMFDIFPDNPHEPTATGVRNLQFSLESVVQNHASHIMAVQRYDIRRPESEGNGFEERYWSPVNSPVFGKDGNLVHIIHRVEDVTEFIHLKQQEMEEHQLTQELQKRTKQMEADIYLRAQELQEVNRQLRVANEELAKAHDQACQAQARSTSILESITDGFTTVDHDWYFTYVNEEAARLLQKKSCQELLGKHLWQEACPEAVGTALEREFHRAILSQVTVEFEEFYLPSNRWFEIHAYPCAVGLSVYFRDITERKQSEAALRASEERFHLLLENVKDYAIFFLDTERRITRWNSGAERILGYPEAEILGQPGSIIFTPEDRQQGADQRELDKAATEGRAENERWHVKKDGSRFWGSGIVTRLQDETGQLQGFAKIMRDTTERKLAEDERNQLLAREYQARTEAEAANRIKDEFLAVLSHELRSPLNPILGWSKLLRSRKFDDKTTDRALETIERNAKLQIQLIEDLLDVSRILQGKLSLNVCPVDLATTIEAAIETVSLAAQAKSIEIQTVLDHTVGQVAGDPNRLQQVVWNLLSNAVKFTPDGGRVEVRLECSTDGGDTRPYAQIKVIDTGKGIDPNFLPHVFDYFRQADSTTTRVFGGLGLGLAIVRHLVQLHGGAVWAESLGEGHGATFIVRLPLRTIDSQTIEESKQPDYTLDLSNLKILVVDDELDSREFVAFVLEQCGAVVTAVASAEDALATLALEKPDLLLSDVGMPEKDGYMLIRQIRTMPPEQGGQIPAIALTAYASENDSQLCLSAGFQRHLAKPVEPAQLITTVATLIGSKS